MDYLLAEFFGSYSDPIDLVCRFFFVMLVMDGIFGIVSTLLKPLIDRR